MINDTFRHELKYIKMEIRRSAGKERRYWLHEKKKLWLSLIPFYRRWISAKHLFGVNGEMPIT